MGKVGVMKFVKYVITVTITGRSVNGGIQRIIFIRQFSDLHDGFDHRTIIKYHGCINTNNIFTSAEGVTKWNKSHL